MPGGGHMYLGLMTRGTQLMAAFWLSFIMAVMLELPILGVPAMIILFFYAQFDAAHNRRQLMMGYPAEDTMLFPKLGFAWTPVYTGILLLILGGWLLFQNMLNFLARTVPGLYRLLSEFSRMMPGLLIILAGLYIISQYNRKRSSHQGDSSPAAVEEK